MVTAAARRSAAKSRRPSCSTEVWNADAAGVGSRIPRPTSSSCAKRSRKAAPRDHAIAAACCTSCSTSASALRSVQNCTSWLAMRSATIAAVTRLISVGAGIGSCPTGTMHIRPLRAILRRRGAGTGKKSPRGAVLILASSALPSAPLRASRSATAPEQGRGHDRLAGVSVYPPMGVIFGEALYPVPSHYRLHMHRRLIRGLTSPST